MNPIPTLRSSHLFLRLLVVLGIITSVIAFFSAFPQILIGIISALLLVMGMFTVIYAFLKIIKWVVFPCIFFFGIGAVMTGKTDVFLKGLIDFLRVIFNY